MSSSPGNNDLPPKRVSIRATGAQHEIWSGAAFEQEVSLEEWMRRAADDYAIREAPGTNPDGRSARILRELISRYQGMLDAIEGKGELGIVTLLGCTGICHKAMEILPFT